MVRVSKKIPLKCSICDSEYLIYPCELGKRHTCGKKECKSKWGSGENSPHWKDKIEKECPICHIKYDVNPSHVNQKTCLKKECKSKHRSEAQIKRFKDPEVRRKHSDIQKIAHGTPEGRRKHSDIQIKRFKDPEVRRKHSEAQIKRFKDPEVRRKHSDILKIAHGTPEARKNNSKAQIKRCEDPEVRRVMSEARKKYFEDPEVRRKQSDALIKYFEDPEARKKTSEKTKKYFEDPNSKHYSYIWYGNVSYPVYIACELWKQVNPRTKSFHGYRCIWCGEQIHKGLTGHHVFYEKQACCLSDPETGIYYTNLNVKNHYEKDYIIGENPNYFVSLCQECHGESNGNFENRAVWADKLRYLVDQTGKCYFKVGIEDGLYNIFKKRCVIPTFGFTGTREYQDYENKYKTFLYL